MASNSIKDLSARHEELLEKHKEAGGTPIVPNEEYEDNAIELIEALDDKIDHLDSESSIERLTKFSDFWRRLYRYCKVQNVYLRIERIPGYSPVDPDPDGSYQYRLDCFRRAGHEDGTITQDEADLRSLTAVVYREYTDASYSTIDMTPLIATDLSEPPADRRVPGPVIYTRPGRRLRIHVQNDDIAPHSLHMHGLRYGINSDGAFPFGVEIGEGVRSDQICPGNRHIYEYDVKSDMTGAWVFHDHFMHIGMNARLGLIGGVVVRDTKWPKADLEVPFFMHTMAGRRGQSLFDSGDIAGGGGVYDRVFETAGEFEYKCFYHGMMGGKVVVEAGAPMTANVTILDNSFEPPIISIAPGGTITWTNDGIGLHTVYESGSSSGQRSHTINGRSFAGNTPVIGMETGQRIRWYVFNHDFGHEWHNFHPHGNHWEFGGQNLDNRSIGPAESFVVDTIAPPVVLPACGKKYAYEKTKKVEVSAHYPVHCHVEPHVMAGMVALMRVRQKIDLPVNYIEELPGGLPDVGSDFVCPVPTPKLCVSTEDNGSWTTLPDSPEFAVHGALLKSSKVIIWSGHAELGPGFGLNTALYDPAKNTYTTVPFSDDDDLFCAGHAFLPDGRLVAGGGANQGQVKTTHIFDPDTEHWSKLEGGDLRDFRWYPSMITLADGRIAIVSGTAGGLGGVVEEIEVLDLSKPAPPAGTDVHYWDLVGGSAKPFTGLYPGLHIVPTGELFFTRTGWNAHIGLGDAASRFEFFGPTNGSWTDFAPLAYPDRKEGASVILVDDTGASPTAKVLVMGGQSGAEPAIPNCEIIDITDPGVSPGWTEVTRMIHPRIGMSAVILPDGRVMAVGGRQTPSRFDPSPIYVMNCEIYDPATDTWAETPPMAYPRQYHSAAVLLADGRVFASGGVDRTLGGGAAGNQKTSEIYTPQYLAGGPGPAITAAPASASFGDVIAVETPNPGIVLKACLLAPGSISHHTDTQQRHVNMSIDSTTAAAVNVRMPGSAEIAPPGVYMLFLIGDTGAPSVSHFIQLGP